MNENTLTHSKQQKDWINFLKATSTFFIVFIHSISHIWTGVSPNTALWKVAHFPFLFSRIPVLLFFMCSGCTMLKRERSIDDILKKNIFQIAKVYIFWMLIYGLKSCFSMYQEGLASFRTCFNALVKSVLFGHYHTWFIFTLIALYLITPFLCLIVKDKKRTEYFLLLSFIFTILIPMLQPIEAFRRLSESLANFNMTFVTGYVLYYVAGYYITQMRWTKKHTWFSFLLFIISFGSTGLITMYQSLLSGNATFEIFGNFSLLAFLCTISLFGTIRGLEHFSFPPFFSKITIYGFGIYLMHPLFIEYFNHITDFRIFILIPIFYLFCLLTCWLIGKNKLLSYLFIK